MFPLPVPNRAHKAAAFLVLVPLFAAILIPNDSIGHPRHHSCFGRQATEHGTPRRDRIIGTRGNDVLVGLGGNDWIKGNGGDDRICGGAGIDRLVGGAGGDRLAGGGGPDTLRGERGSDRLSGGLNFDGLTGGCGDDALVGGRGRDLTQFGVCGRSGRRPVNISLRDRVAIGDGTDRVVGVEDVYANDSAPTVLEGDSHDNTLVSSRGADHIYGWGGNDVLDGQAGDNTNDGGLGHDICLNPDGEAGAASCEN